VEDGEKSKKVIFLTEGGRRRGEKKNWGKKLHNFRGVEWKTGLKRAGQVERTRGHLTFEGKIRRPSTSLLKLHTGGVELSALLGGGDGYKDKGLKAQAVAASLGVLRGYPGIQLEKRFWELGK